MYLKTIIAALALGLFPSLLMSQAMPTATRRLDMQVGGLFSIQIPAFPATQPIATAK